MPRINKIAYDRTIGQQQAFTTFVVEGPENNHPGMIRRLRFDRDGGAEHWLRCEWEPTQDGVNRRLAAYEIRSDMQVKGAKLLQEYYEEIGRTDLFDAYCKYESQHEPGQYWPDEMLPPKVLELRKIKSKRDASKWDLPDDLAPIGDVPTEPAEAPKSEPKPKAKVPKVL